MAGLATLFAYVAVRFAAGQSVWTDEATQLSGLSLGFADQLKWLAGRLPQAFTVRFTDVYANRGGEWQMVAWHTALARHGVPCGRMRSATAS